MTAVASVELFWLPLGAGGNVVRLNGRAERDRDRCVDPAARWASAGLECRDRGRRGDRKRATRIREVVELSRNERQFTEPNPDFA